MESLGTRLISEVSLLQSEGHAPLFVLCIYYNYLKLDYEVAVIT